MRAVSAKEPGVNTCYRIWLSKLKDTKYLSHHDLAQVLEQAIRRADLPANLYGRYNPRIKISFFSSVPVGIIAEGEPVDLWLDKSLDGREIIEKLQKNLPADINILDIDEIESRLPYILQIIYIIELSCPLSPQKSHDLLNRDCIYVTRNKKGFRKEFDVRPFIQKCLIENSGHSSIISLTISMTPKGSVSPWEILKLLEIPMEQHVISITRKRIKLMDIIDFYS